MRVLDALGGCVLLAGTLAQAMTLKTDTSKVLVRLDGPSARDWSGPAAAALLNERLK